MGDWVVGGVQMQLTIVLLSFGWCGERCVGLGDEDEAFRGVGVGWVAVWMVGFGEGVEGP